MSSSESDDDTPHDLRLQRLLNEVVEAEKTYTESKQYVQDMKETLKIAKVAERDAERNARVANCVYEGARAQARKQHGLPTGEAEREARAGRQAERRRLRRAASQAEPGASAQASAEPRRRQLRSSTRPRADQGDESGGRAASDRAPPTSVVVSTGARATSMPA